jgi:hypothetical protein
MAEQYTNIRLILDKILRHPLMQDLSLESAVDYTVDFMRIVGVPNMFMEKTEILEIEKYRAMLPDDYYQMIQVRKVKGGTFRYSTDTFHMSESEEPNDRNISDFTYKIQGNIIYTSMEDGEIEISYQSIATDEEGYPLLPDNSSFTRALRLYIKKEHFTTLFDMGKIQATVLNQALQDYAWAVGDCQTEFNRLSLDKAESFYNSWRTLIMRDTEHRTGFINNGTKERLKLQ